MPAHQQPLRVPARAALALPRRRRERESWHRLVPARPDRGIDAGAQLAKQQHGDLSRGPLAEYVEAATLGGARALHRPDLGRIAPGATADLVAFALDGLRLGPVEDPLRTLVLSGTGRDAHFSMVGGRVVMRDGAIPGGDVEALRHEGQRIFEKLRAAYGERDYRANPAGTGTGTGSARELFPPVLPIASTGVPAGGHGG